MNIIDYKLLDAPLTQIQEEVCTLIKEGWQPLGAHNIYPFTIKTVVSGMSYESIKFYATQALVKYGKPNIPNLFVSSENYKVSDSIQIKDGLTPI